MWHIGGVHLVARANGAPRCLHRSEEERHKAVEAITRRLPKRVKRKRPIRLEDGSSAGMEEYYDYIFPEEEDAAPKLKILEAAYRWKRQKQDNDA